MRLRWYSLSRNPLFLFTLAGLIFIFIQIITMGSTPTEDDHFLARAVGKQLSDASVLNYGYLKEKSSKMPYSALMRKMPERKNERDVITYQTFTKDAMYHIEKGIRGTIRTNLQKYQPDAFDELQEVIVHGAHLLRSEELQTYQMPPEHVLENMGTKYSDFISGVVRTERNRGTHYELLFKDTASSDFSSPEKSKESIKKIELFRPFAPIQHVRTETISPSELVHFVLPLSGRVEMFTHFIGVFLNSAVGLNDENNAVNVNSVYLSIVYFGEGIETIRAILQKYVASFPGFTNYRILVGEGEFSRGKGLHKGIVTPLGPEFTSFDHGLLFFIDVDIGFTKDILELCRSYTIPGKSVYYPIVFSMYNPAIVGVPKKKKKKTDNPDEDDEDEDDDSHKEESGHDASRLWLLEAFWVWNDVSVQR